MYDKTIDSSNKIISSDDIKDIIIMMNDILTKYKAISAAEIKQNEMLDYDEQIYTFKDNSSDLNFRIDFYDDTSSKIDNFDEFIYIYENRLNEIKYLYVYFNLCYNKTIFIPNRKNEYYSQNISLTIDEKNIDIRTSLSSEDNILDELYNKIRSMILNAPEKYDKVIKKRTTMSILVGLALGFIPAILITSLLLVNESIRELFINTIPLYPVITIVLAFILGTVLSQIVFEPNYKSIAPKKKYDGYKNGKSVYVDDIEDFKKKSEVLIGKNYRNLEYRKKIITMYQKYKKFIPIELIIVGLITVILAFIEI